MDDRAKPRRRFSLIDAMILVAATAVGLAAYRAVRPEVQLDFDSVVATTTLLTAWSWATVLLGLKRPRAAMRRLMSRPGHAACVVASLVSLPTALLFSLAYLVHHVMVRPPFDPASVVVVSSIATGPAISASWCIMALSRRWRSETDWIEWLGRVLATCWMLAFLAMAFLW
jgi:hypothetical protein